MDSAASEAGSVFCSRYYSSSCNILDRGDSQEAEEPDFILSSDGYY